MGKSYIILCFYLIHRMSARLEKRAFSLNSPKNVLVVSTFFLGHFASGIVSSHFTPKTFYNRPIKAIIWHWS